MLNLTITTVERTVFASANIRQVTLPTADGEITVLPHHIPLMSVLGTGEVKIVKADDTEQYIFVDGGIIQLDNNHIELLANTAERADEMTMARIEEAKRRAEKLLEERPVDVDLAVVEASLKQELLKEKIVRRRKQ